MSSSSSSLSLTDGLDNDGPPIEKVYSPKYDGIFAESRMWFPASEAAYALHDAWETLLVCTLKVLEAS